MFTFPLLCRVYPNKEGVDWVNKAGLAHKKKNRAQKNCRNCVGEKFFSAQVVEEKQQILLRCAATIYKVNETWGVHKVK